VNRRLADLVDAGYVTRERHGRRNRYVINRDAPMLRHTAQNSHDIGRLIDLLGLQTRIRHAGARTAVQRRLARVGQLRD
jgi:hypothetical protein